MNAESATLPKTTQLIGQVVHATVTTGCCDAGERGVVYDCYEPGGISVYFQSRRWGSFSPKEQAEMLHITPHVLAGAIDFDLAEHPNFALEADAGQFDHWFG